MTWWSRLRHRISYRVSKRDSSAWLWQGDKGCLRHLGPIQAEDLAVLRGIDDQRDKLLTNTRRLVQSLPAHDALLWGVRGMGKSSLIAAVCAHIGQSHPLCLVEVRPEQWGSLDDLVLQLAQLPHPTVLFCDDVRFHEAESGTHVLKRFLEGSLGSRTTPFVFYATSNLRHLIQRDMDHDSDAHPGDVLQDKMALCDRFGLWLGFHTCSDDQWRAMIEAHAHKRRLRTPIKQVMKEAEKWAMQRGGRNGRSVAQCILHIAAREAEAGDNA